LIEDAYEPAMPVDEVPAEDGPELLEGMARALEEEAEGADEVDAETFEASRAAAARVADRDDDSDTAAIVDDDDVLAKDRSSDAHGDWERELSAHQVVVELKRIETEVRRYLEGVDDKRKRKLSGSRRWRELQEDLISWQHTSRIDADAVPRLMELIARRDYLFRRLNFLSRTRPGWNS